MVKKETLGRYAGVFLILSASLIAASAYAATPTVTSAKITGPNSITIYYSEPVTTTLSDYSGSDGSLSGRNLTGLSGANTSQVMLTFDGSPVPPNSSGTITIGSTLKSISDGSPFVVSGVNVTDGQAPALTSFTVSSNNTNNAFANAQDVLTFSLSADEPLATVRATVAGNALAVNGSGPYSFSYTMTGSEPASVPIVISLVDDASNSSQFSFVLPAQSNSTASVSSVTSNANSSGVLKLGDTIIFTLTPSVSEPAATINGSYNERALSWSTSNGGATYTASYLVEGGDPNQTSPLQITGVTLTDASGATSAPFSGSDVMKTIDTQGPILTEASPVPSVVTTSTPTYGFISSEAGTITYYGDCSSNTTAANAGQNSIVLNALANGLHSNCTLAVTDAAGISSNRVPLDPFTVNAAVSAVPVTTTVVPTTVTQTPAVAATPGYVFSHPLSVGSTGEDVLELQSHLTRAGVYSGPITGTFGPLTEAGVVKFQTENGLTPLGSVGPATRGLLNAMGGN